MDERATRWILPLAAIGCGLAPLVLLLTPGEPTSDSTMLNSAAALAVTAITLVLIGRRVGETPHWRDSLGWCFIALTACLWFVADWVAWPGPGWLWRYVGYLTFAIALPLVAFPTERLPHQRWLLDAIVLVVVAAVVSVEVFLRPLTDTAGVATLSAAIAVSYPLLDLGLLAALIFSMYAQGNASRRTLALMLAVGARMVSDVAHVSAAAFLGYEAYVGSFDLGWMASYVFIGIAATVDGYTTRSAAEPRAPAPARWGLIIPYCAVVFLTAITIGASIFERPPPSLVIGACIAIALAAVRQTTVLFEYLQLHVQLQSSLSSERLLARTDPLTGALNHGAITAALGHAIATAEHGATHAIVMVDVDGLKATNDTFGHQEGDKLLTAVAGALNRPGAVVGRYAGDEFAVLLHNTSRQEAERYVAEVRQALAATSLRDATAGARIPVRASLGVSVFPSEAETVPDLIKLADSAMYAAKRAPLDVDSAEPGLARRRDDAAHRLIAELIPLLASPGHLRDKLDLIGRQLAAACRYDGVRIAIFGPEASRPIITSLSGSNSAEEWVSSGKITAGGPLLSDQPLRSLLQRTKRPLIVDDLALDERFTAEFRSEVQRTGVRCVLVAPMLWHDDVIGSIGAGRQSPASFSPEDATLLMTVAGQITAIVRMASMVESLEATSEKVRDAQAETVLMLAAVAEVHDRTTGLHLLGIRKLVEALALDLGLARQHAYDLGLASVLHDIGKVSVPDDVLASTGRLAGEQWETMKQHTVWGGDFLRGREGFELAAVVARSHHERWDGTGYPDGLAGESIPLEAAIVTVADSFDAMTDDRPYRPGLSTHAALAEIVANRGAQFSPQVVDALLRLHEAGQLDTSCGHTETRSAA